MGFHYTFINCIMQCITNPTYKININGDIAGEVKPTRGLRQGDPLSPYIFHITEGISRLLNQAELCGDIQGLSLSRGGPTIIIYFFADDSFIFCNANIHNAQKNSEMLKIYEKCSGGKVNFIKSAIFFSKNCSESEKTILVKWSGNYKGLT